MMKEKVDMITIFSFSITEFWKGLCDKISILGWYVFKKYFTF